MGGDKTVSCTYQPNKVLPLRKVQGKELTQVKHMASQDAMAAGAKLIQMTIDSTGLGGGPTDDLRQMGYPVLGVNFAQKAQNLRFFKRLKDEIMWNVREVFRAGEIAIPPDDELIGQLSSIKYKIDQVSGVIEIESKEDYKKRGLKSPDCAWALALALWGSKRVKVSPRIRPIAYEEQRFNKRETAKWY
jgi:phage FluMu gp28-like protein